MKKTGQLISIICIFLTCFLFGTNSLFSYENGEQKVYDQNQLSEIQEAGTYPVKIIYYDKSSGENIEEIVYITVTYPRTIISKQFGEAIDAMDVVVPIGTMENITNEDLILLTNAHAWDINDGSSIPIVKVKYQKKWNRLNLYTASFVTAKGTQTTVTILESDGTLLSLSEEYIQLSEVNDKIEITWLLVFSALAIFLILIIIIAYFIVWSEIRETQRVLHEENFE